jgi:(E)-4-hydroxy-3-methylbut-2-enyl-diphosphate synthase
VDELFAEIDRSLARGGVQADNRRAAEAADWLERIEAENAGELTPERIARMESDRTPEGADEVLGPGKDGAQSLEPVSGRRFKRTTA